MPLCSADFQFSKMFGRTIRRYCAAAFSLQVPKSCTNLDPTLFYISILGTYSNVYGKIKCQRLVFPYHSHARAVAAGLPRHDHVQIIPEHLFPVPVPVLYSQP